MIEELNTIPAAARLVRCQVDVAFPPGHKLGSRPHCSWHADFNARPQIIEVLDTGWETYHFATIDDARRFAQQTRQRVESGEFAAGRLPPGVGVTIQLRATLEIVEDQVAERVIE